MQNAEKLTREQIIEFLKGSEGIDSGAKTGPRCMGGYRECWWVRSTLCKARTAWSNPSLPEQSHTSQDVALLATVDRAHDWLSGPATLHILKREHEQFGHSKFARLAESGANQIRRGAPGFRASTPCIKAIGMAPKGWISEQFVLPVIESLLHQFPFRILGFHSDNGSEFVNYEVAKLLKSLLIEFTRSRANRTQDNALVEFYTAQLTPYLNFHRPCGFATVTLDARGKRRRRCQREDYATPYEKLKSLPEAEKHLKENMSFERLNQTALTVGDTECARKMSAAKAELLRRCKIESPRLP